MRILTTLLSLLIIATLTAGCGDSESEMAKKLSEEVSASINAKTVEKIPGLVEVINGVLDDGVDTAFIFCRTTKNQGAGGDKADIDRLAIVLKRKKQWQAKFPNRKIVAMSTFIEKDAEESGAHGIPLGLLIQYEQH